jgi:nucleosome binding factor SPN SPT16 subunit
MMFPHMSGRKSEGALEAHANGFRFLSNKGEKFDIIYSNVKHAIFQPCDKEHEVLIHFHLKTPLIVGKKKHYDVQFYTEVIEASQALDRAKTGYDPDELEEEAQERRRRQMLNKQFKKYVEQVRLSLCA